MVLGDRISVGSAEVGRGTPRGGEQAGEEAFKRKKMEEFELGIGRERREKAIFYATVSSVRLSASLGCGGSDEQSRQRNPQDIGSCRGRIWVVCSRVEWPSR